LNDFKNVLMLPSADYAFMSPRPNTTLADFGKLQL